MLSGVLRPLAENDPAAYGPELVATLQALATARLRGGDWWGSRGPAKEAKALAKQLSEGAWTVAPLPSLKEVVEQASPKPSFRPEWIRMPKKGRCPYCGLTRSFLWQLVSPNAANGYRPPVQSVVLRTKGIPGGRG